MDIMSNISLDLASMIKGQLIAALLLYLPIPKKTNFLMFNLLSMLVNIYINYIKNFE